MVAVADAFGFQGEEGDFVRGIEPRLSRSCVLKSIDVRRRTTNLDMSVGLYQFNVEHECVEAARPPPVNVQGCQGACAYRRTSPWKRPLLRASCALLIHGWASF